MTVKEVKVFCNEHQINADRMKIYKHGGLIHIEMADIPKELIEKISRIMKRPEAAGTSPRSTAL